MNRLGVKWFKRLCLSSSRKSSISVRPQGTQPAPPVDVLRTRNWHSVRSKVNSTLRMSLSLCGHNGRSYHTLSKEQVPTRGAQTGVAATGKLPFASLELILGAVSHFLRSRQCGRQTRDTPKWGELLCLMNIHHSSCISVIRSPCNSIIS